MPQQPKPDSWWKDFWIYGGAIQANLLLFKSVKEIGSRTMSSLKQLIEDVVSRVVTNLHQRALRLGEPFLTLDVVDCLSGQRHLHPGVLRQQQRLQRLKPTLLVNGIHDSCHGITLPESSPWTSRSFAAAPVVMIVEWWFHWRTA